MWGRLEPHLSGICASICIWLRGGLVAFQFCGFAFVSIVPELGLIIGNVSIRWG
jgi:hypothetical protein